MYPSPKEIFTCCYLGQRVHHRHGCICCAPAVRPHEIWLTQSERGQFESESEVPEPYKDSIWGEEDGVFRVTLPNGEYRITCYFHSGAAQPLEINLIANGEKKIKKLRIPTGNETIELSYDVTITDERLTQVIYTRARGAYKRWGWSGCTIERRK